MTIRLVTYDLNQEKKNRGDYEGLLKAIKQYSWARLSESSYAIETNREPKDLFSEFYQHLDSNDFLLVMTLNQPWWGTQKQDVMDWLLQKL